MNAGIVKHLSLRWVMSLRSPNPLVVAAGGLLLLSLWIGWWVLPQMEVKLTQLRDDLAWETQFQQRRQAFGPRILTVPAPVSAADSLRNVLGEQRSVVHDLQRVYDLAASAGLTLPQGEYRQSCDAGIQVCKFHMQFSLSGPYDRLRAWAQAVLQALPHAAVDTLVLQRETVSDEELIATLGFTLYLKVGPNATPATHVKGTP